MLQKIIKIVMPITIFVGVFMVGIAILTNTSGEGTVISEESIAYGYGGQVWVWHYYKFHVDKYLENLQTSIKIDQLADMLPAMPILKDAPGKWQVVEWIKYIANFMFVYLINWLIYILNWLLLAPLKLVLYPVNIILSLIGVNTSNNVFIEGFRTLYSINIPLIPDFA